MYGACVRVNSLRLYIVYVSGSGFSPENSIVRAKTFLYLVTKNIIFLYDSYDETMVGVGFF